MKSKAGRVILACCVSATLVGLVYLLVFMRPTRVAAQALPNAGKFLVGSALGEERAGFSGRPKVLVFVSADSPEWPTISTCLQSAAVEAEMVDFTGVLVDANLEPDVEGFHRKRDNLQVIIRGLNGGFIGALHSGFTCDDFVTMLKDTRKTFTGEVEKSPIYASLLDSPNALDFMVKNGEASKAARFVELLSEFEGASSPAVLAAQAVIGK